MWAQNHFLKPHSISLEKRLLQLMYVLGAQPRPGMDCVLLEVGSLEQRQPWPLALWWSVQDPGAGAQQLSDSSPQCSGGHVAEPVGRVSGGCMLWTEARGVGVSASPMPCAALCAASAFMSPRLRCVSKQVRLLLWDRTLN